MKVSTVAQMRAMDQAAMEQFRIPTELLMENAGLAAYRVLAEHFGVADKTILIVCGIGNNGGDGLVVARHLYSNGGHLKIVLVGEPTKFQGAARLNFEIVSRLPIPMQPIDSVSALETDIAQCDVIVDGLLGTGLSRPVEGLYRAIIERINASHKPVLSIDIPSGVNGDTGQVMGCAIQAETTVTFGLPKIGNILFPGSQLGGKLAVSHISFPPELYQADALTIALNDPPRLPPRAVAGHKGTFGDVLVIAGAANYFGAPYFAAAAFLKAGGGYSRLAAPKSIVPVIAGKASEIVFVPQHETTEGSLALKNVPALLELAHKVDIVILGPGLSLHEETQELIRTLLPAIEKPVILDGDGLTAISQDATILKQRTAETILTPHLGEMARLTRQSIHDIETNPIPLLQETARNLNAIIVLKGAHSLIGYPDGRVFINLTGNSGMATAGSGDVLTGTIAAMFGLGLPIPYAVRKGVDLHGRAGDLAAAEKGEDGITAQDILEALPRAVKQDREGLEKKVFPEII